MSLLKLLAAAALFLLIPFLNPLTAQTIQITVLEGPEVRCCTDSVVKIQITPNPNGSFTEIKLDWGDNSGVLTIPANTPQPLIYTHTYSTYHFCGDCKNYQCSNPIITGFCYNMSVFGTYASLPPENVSKILTFKVKPEATITAQPAIPCVGASVTFTANVCPANDNSLSLKWTLPDGTMSTAPNPSYTFTQAQPHQVQLQVLESSFVCGNGSASLTINPLNEAVAALEADSNANLVTAGQYKVCLEGGMAVVRLTAAASVNETPPYNWSFINPPGGNAQWYPIATPTPTTEVVRVKFSQAGVYTFTVRVNNACNNPDEETITIEVIDAPVLNLQSQPDVCEPLNYTPNPYNTSAVYTLDGVVQSTFPVLLPLRASPYIITASLTNECGNQQARDTFFVRLPPDLEIISPSSPLTVCINSGPIILHGNLPGDWTGSTLISTASNGDTLFTPSIAGMYQLIFSQGNGACSKADTLRINVVNTVALTLNDPGDGCIQLAYTPDPLLPGVTYNINGVDVSNFPFLMDSITANYIVTATATNECGPINTSIDLFIDKPVDVHVISPVDTTLCSGTAAIPLTASDTVGHWVGAHISQSPQGWVFMPDVPGNYTLIFERGTGDCRRADSVFVKVEPGDGVSAGPDLYVCISEGMLVLPAGIPANGTYSGFGITNGTIDLNLLVPDSAYQYTYTVSSLPEACNDDQINVTIGLPPDASFQLNADTSCVGAIVEVFPVTTTGVEYAVNWGDGIQNNQLSHIYSSPQAYTVTLTVNTIHPLTQGALCSAAQTDAIYILQPIDASNIRFSMHPVDTGCGPLIVSFTNESVAENGQYEWNFGNGQTYVGQTPPAITFEQGTEDTMYVVRLLVKNGCDSISFSDTITVFPRPHAQMGISYQQPCSGGVLKASVLSTGNPANNVFYTSTGIVAAANVTEPTYFQFFTDSIPLTVGIWLVTSNQCDSDTAYQEIVVHPTDVVAVIGLPDTTKLCVGAPLSFINYATTGAPIEWIFSNGNTYSGDTISIVTTTPGTYTLTLKVFGCGFDSMTVPIYVRPLPELSVSHTLQQCPDVPIEFTIISNTALIRLYYGDGDSTAQKISEHFYPGPGLYYPEAIAISNAGCVSEWAGNVTVLTPPVAGISAGDSVCVAEQVLFTGISNQAGHTCSWYFGDGNVSDACTTTHAYATPGLFTARLVIFSTEGCRDTAYLPVYVRNRPTADFMYMIKEKCTPAIVAFSNTAQGATGLNWNLGDGSLETNSDFEHIYLNGGGWNVQLIATNEGICSDTIVKQVTVYETPAFDLELAPQCMRIDGTNLTIHTPVENYVVVTGTTYSQPGNYHEGLADDDYHISIKSPVGCENDTIIVVLPVNELYLSLVRDSFSILLGDSIQLETEVNQTGVTFSWTPPVYLNVSDTPDPKAKPFRDIYYIVSGTNLLGCVKYDTAYVAVTVDRDSSLFIPNAFSPNEDGINDVFYVRNMYNPSIAGIASFQIFDKFGEKVFDVHDLPEGKNARTENPYFGWDGKFRSDKAEAGAYYYQITLLYVDGFERPLRGTLLLIR